MPLDRVTFCLYVRERESLDDFDFDCIYDQVDNVRNVCSSLSHVAVTEQREKPSFYLSIFLIKNPINKKSMLYDMSDQYNRIRSILFEMLVEPLAYQEISIDMVKFEVKSTELDYLIKSNSSNGNIIDLMKIRAVIDFANCNHLQMDSTTIIHNYTDFYRYTFGAETPKNQFIANFYGSSLTVNNKVMYTPAKANYSFVLNSPDAIHNGQIISVSIKKNHLEYILLSNDEVVEGILSWFDIDATLMPNKIKVLRDLVPYHAKIINKLSENKLINKSFQEVISQKYDEYINASLRRKPASFPPPNNDNLPLYNEVFVNTLVTMGLVHADGLPVLSGSEFAISTCAFIVTRKRWSIQENHRFRLDIEQALMDLPAISIGAALFDYHCFSNLIKKHVADLDDKYSRYDYVVELSAISDVELERDAMFKYLSHVYYTLREGVTFLMSRISNNVKGIGLKNDFTEVIKELDRQSPNGESRIRGDSMEDFDTTTHDSNSIRTHSYRDDTSRNTNLSNCSFSMYSETKSPTPEVVDQLDNSGPNPHFD